MLGSYIFRQISAKRLLKAKATLLWRLSFRMGSFAKACLQPLKDLSRHSGWSTKKSQLRIQSGSIFLHQLCPTQMTYWAKI